MYKIHHNTPQAISKRADSVNLDVRVLNYNSKADSTHVRAKHSTQHGEVKRFVETHDAGGKSIRSMRAVILQPKLYHGSCLNGMPDAYTK